MGRANSIGIRLFRTGWKLAVLAAIAGFIVYRIRFAPLPVASQAASTGPIVSEVLGTGTLEARVQATISAKISGLLTEVRADQGERVTKNQVLATLDDGELRQQVAVANAELAATKAGVDRAGADIARAEAVAIQARASYARNSDLAKQKMISDDDFDKAKQQRDIAEAELKRAQMARIEIERQVTKAEESLRYYQSLLADAQILSPFDGLVVRRSREPGDVVVPGSAILQVISTTEMWVSAWVDESVMSSVAAGQPVRVVFRSDPDKSYSGIVTRMAPLADRETREFLLDVTVKELPRNWAVGQRAEVYIEVARKPQALLAPQSAIVWQKGKPGLFVNSGGHAQWRSVELGLRGEKMVEIAKGLGQGDIIVWPRDPKDAALSDGRAVKAVKTP